MVCYAAKREQFLPSTARTDLNFEARWIREIGWTIVNIYVEVETPGETNRIFGWKSPHNWVVVSGAIIVETTADTAILAHNVDVTTGEVAARNSYRRDVIFVARQIVQPEQHPRGLLVLGKVA